MGRKAAMGIGRRGREAAKGKVSGKEEWKDYWGREGDKGKGRRQWEGKETSGREEAKRRDDWEGQWQKGRNYS